MHQHQDAVLRRVVGGLSLAALVTGCSGTQPAEGGKTSQPAGTQAACAGGDSVQKSCALPTDPRLVGSLEVREPQGQAKVPLFEPRPCDWIQISGGVEIQSARVVFEDEVEAELSPDLSRDPGRWRCTVGRRSHPIRRVEVSYQLGGSRAYAQIWLHCQPDVPR